MVDRSTRTTWAVLKKRVFAIDVLVCPHCARTRKLIALLTDGLVVRKIRNEPRPRRRASTRRPAREPPERRPRVSSNGRSRT